MQGYTTGSKHCGSRFELHSNSWIRVAEINNKSLIPSHWQEWPKLQSWSLSLRLEISAERRKHECTFSDLVVIVVIWDYCKCQKFILPQNIRNQSFVKSFHSFVSIILKWNTEEDVTLRRQWYNYSDTPRITQSSLRHMLGLKKRPSADSDK